MSAGQDIAKRVLGIYNGLTEVRVITLLEDATIELAENNGHVEAKVSFPPKPTKSLVTLFKLDSGDTVNTISPGLEDNTALREFHTTQVDNAVKVVPDNLRMLVDLAKDVIALAKEHDVDTEEG